MIFNHCIGAYLERSYSKYWLECLYLRSEYIEDTRCDHENHPKHTASEEPLYLVAIVHAHICIPNVLINRNDTVTIPAPIARYNSILPIALFVFLFISFSLYSILNNLLFHLI